jgi:hypothetical protein
MGVIEDGYILLDLVFITHTLDAVAVLIDEGSGNPVWLPKSQIHLLCGDCTYGDYNIVEPHEDVMIEVPEWLAIEKGLV